MPIETIEVLKTLRLFYQVFTKRLEQNLILIKRIMILLQIKLYRANHQIIFQKTTLNHLETLKNK
jgi:hypothetical protein